MRFQIRKPCLELVLVFSIGIVFSPKSLRERKPNQKSCKRLVYRFAIRVNGRLTATLISQRDDWYGRKKNADRNHSILRHFHCRRRVRADQGTRLFRFWRAKCNNPCRPNIARLEFRPN